MVSRTKEESNSYMERSSPGIFGVIQIHARDSLRPNDLSVHEERTRRRLQRVCCQMEECGINSPTILTNREENSIFVDTLPSSYYDMLIVNTFVGVWRLNVFYGKNRGWNKERKNHRH